VNRLVLAVLAAIALALAARPAAAAPKESATAAVKSANDRLRVALDEYANAKGAARRAAREKVRKAVDSLLDFDEIVRAAAGKHWNEMTPEQRKRFGDALRGVMEASYLLKGRDANSVDVSKVRTEYLGEEKRGGKTIVKTRLHSGQDNARVDYVLEQHKGKWRAVDVLTEDVSLVETYRDQIQELWPKRGFEGVVSTLERKRKNLEAKLDAELPPAAQQGASR
jgi:phospholipid transport system substrate-binding protein